MDNLSIYLTIPHYSIMPLSIPFYWNLYQETHMHVSICNHLRTSRCDSSQYTMV